MLQNKEEREIYFSIDYFIYVSLPFILSCKLQSRVALANSFDVGYYLITCDQLLYLAWYQNIVKVLTTNLLLKYFNNDISLELEQKTEFLIAESQT